MLLWLLSVMPSDAAHAPRAMHTRSHAVPARAFVLKHLARQTLKAGRAMVRIRKVSPSLLTRRAHFQRDTRPSRADDDDAIQNDAPAAHFHVDPFLELRRLGSFVHHAEQQPFTFTYSPRTPRGPPAAD